jgi:predicted dehydrogenase
MKSLTRRTVLAGSALQAGLAASAQPEPIRLPRKLRLGMIGLDGHTGEILSHLKRLPGIEFVAVADANSAALKRFVGQHTYSDYRQMLASERLDVVAICNNNGERAGAILACAERKLPFIAEKPFAIEMDELARVRKAVERAGAPFSTLLPLRFDPPYSTMKRLVAAGEIGEVAQIASQKSYKMGKRADWYKKRATYGGTIAWIGIHMIDLMRFASGREFTEAYSVQGHIGFPDYGDMETVTASVFRLDNGGAATLRMDYYRPETAPTHGDDRLRLSGPGGVIEYQASTGLTLLKAGAKPQTITDLDPKGSVFLDFIGSAWLGKPAQLTPADIWRVNEITLLARDSAEQRRVVKL